MGGKAPAYPNAVRFRKDMAPTGSFRVKMPLSGGIFAWESVLPTENRIATPVCGLVRNDSVLLTEQHCAYASSSSLLSY